MSGTRVRFRGGQVTRLVLGWWVRWLAESDLFVGRKGGEVGVLEHVCWERGGA